jgi:2-C-methyl-D-erythritol 4-phosphate cytidylyltransferase
MKKYVVVVAGGMGMRMGAAQPKQFLLLRGKPVLWHTLMVFLEAYEELEIVLVLPADFLEAGRELVSGLPAVSRVRLVVGGETRFHSVRNGLALVDEESLVAVHDGVRCLVTVDLVRKCFEQALRVGSAIPVVDCADSVRLLGDAGSKPLDRSVVKLVQTPQTFQGRLLLRAYESAPVVEASGVPVHLIQGDKTNIKITLPIDLLIAEQMLGIGGQGL